jgi:hypothetical protein
MLNMKQSDCRFGGVGFAAGEDLSLKAGHLVKLNSGGDLVLPASAADITPYVVICGADTGYLCGAVPLTSAGNCRVKLAGTCEAGDLLVAKGDGRVEAGVIGGEALPVGMAEEKGVEGQHVLLRPLCVGARGAAGAAGAAGAPGANGATGATGAEGPQGETGMDGGAFHVPVSLIANAPAGNDLIGLILAVFAGPAFDAYPNVGTPVAWVVVSGLTVIDGTAYAVCWKLWQASPPDNTEVIMPVSVIAPGALTTEVRAVQIPETGYCRLSRDDSAIMMGSVVLKVASVSGTKLLGFTFYSV